MTAPSAKPLFRAISGQGPRDRGAPLFGEAPGPAVPERHPLDLYPTGEPDAIRGLLARDGARIAALGGIVWEPAAGRGDMVREIVGAGLSCLYSDVADHGFPGTAIADFFDATESPAPVIITNPPYNRINARDGKGAWLRHTLALHGLLIKHGLTAFARRVANGEFDATFEESEAWARSQTDPQMIALMAALGLGPDRSKDQ